MMFRRFRLRSLLIAVGAAGLGLLAPLPSGPTGIPFGAAAARAAKTDIITLKNGDRMTGEVKRLERGKLSFSTDDMGTLEIEWDKIRSVEARATFEINTLYGAQYFGSLEPGAIEGDLGVVTPLGPLAVEILAVDRIQRIGQTFWGQLDGAIDLGASYTSSSEIFMLDLAADSRLERPRFEIGINLAATLTQQPGFDNDYRSSLGLSYERRFPSLWLLYGQGQVEQNRELGFELRGSLLGAVGRYLVQGRQNDLQVGAGFNLSREKPLDLDATSHIEAAVIFYYDLFALDSPKVDVTVASVTYVGIDEPGRYRANVDVRLKREMLKDFYTSLRGYESYDSRPATEGVEKHDYGVTFALGWSY